MHPNNTTDHPTEEWRDVPGYDGVYQVSNLGRVRSVDRNVTYTNRWGTQTTYRKPEQILSPGLNTGGYLMVSLFHHERGFASTMIHTIVAEAFIGPRPVGHDIHHIDHNKRHNCPENLRYTDEFSHISQHMEGNIPTNAKLTQNDAADILVLIQSGKMSQAAIARKYGVTPGLITMIKQRKRWNR